MPTNITKSLNYFKNKNIIVTGAQGYIGSTLVNILSDVSCNLYLITRSLPKKKIKGRKAKIKYIQKDIRDTDVWEKIPPRTDIIYHFAAQTSSAKSNLSPVEDIKINLLPIVRLIESCQKRNFFPDIILSGSVTEVGYTSKGKFDEAVQESPITVYDINKFTSEKYLQYYSKHLGGRSVTLRLANVYGPGPANSNSDRGVVNLMVKKALNNDPLTLFGGGKYIRDYIYVDDVAEAFIQAAVNILKTNGNFYVIGTGRGKTIKQMANLIRKNTVRYTKKRVSLTSTPFPDKTSRIELRSFTAINKRFKKDTGWQPRITLETGIKKTIEYFLKK